MREFEVVVVGASLAGSSFLRSMPSSLKNVLVVDKANISVGSDKHKPCSGLVSIPAQQTLAELGLKIPDNIYITPKQMQVKVYDAGTEHLKVEKDIVYNVHRAWFEEWIRTQIPSRVEVMSGCKLVGFEKTDNGVVIELAKDGERFKVFTKLLVGADGANSVVRRGLGIADGIEKYAGAEWFVPLDGLAVDQSFWIIIDPELTDYYVWALPKGDELHVGGAFTSKLSKEEIPPRLVATLKRLSLLPEGFKTAGFWAHPILRASEKNHIKLGENTVRLIGEAAGLICPTSAEGYSYALASGNALAHELSTGDRRPMQRVVNRIHKKFVKRKLIYNSLVRTIYFRLFGSNV